jgi:histone acetyltransferase
MSTELLQNDGSIESLKKLIEAKCLFAKQLPKMPREYICRLVFDTKHCVLVLRDAQNLMVGACCFRPFLNQAFEIVFLAVLTTEQVKGYGSLIMNHVKTVAQKNGYTDLVTYADVAAVGYFTKQGFVAIEKSDFPKTWDSHVKDYDGAHLMRCKIDMDLNYLIVGEVISRAKKAFWQHVIKTQKLEAQEGFEKVKEEPMKLSEKIGKVIEAASLHESAWPFLEPVHKKEVSDYLKIVKHPIDLSKIRKKNKKNEYRTIDEFKKDIKLMFSNCRLYNQPDTVYCKEAKILEKFIASKLLD